MKQTRKRRILIVDDSKMNREILTGILEDEYDIVEAEDGKKAIEIMEEGLYSFSIVLLDITMPELDGFGVLHQRGCGAGGPASAGADGGRLSGMPLSGHAGMHGASDAGGGLSVARAQVQLALHGL